MSYTFVNEKYFFTSLLNKAIPLYLSALKDCLAPDIKINLRTVSFSFNVFTNKKEGPGVRFIQPKINGRTINWNEKHANFFASFIQIAAVMQGIGGWYKCEVIVFNGPNRGSSQYFDSGKKIYLIRLKAIS